MFTPQELATIAAALRYWQQEMCPHGHQAMAPYFTDPHAAPLTAEQTEALLVRLKAQDRIS